MSSTIGLVGAGSLSQALIGAWLERGVVDANSILVSNRTSGKLQRVVEQFGVRGVSTNEELVDLANVIIFAVKPQDLRTALEPLTTSFRGDQVIISLAAGISLRDLQKIVRSRARLVRVMPSVATRVRAGVIGVALKDEDPSIRRLLESLFSPLGVVFFVDEGDPMTAVTVGCASGVGLVLELMIYWQEWLEEHGIPSVEAQQMTQQTFLGAALLSEGPAPLVELQARVVSKKGVTASALDSMRELEVERSLRYSFEKGALRDRELGESF